MMNSHLTQELPIKLSHLFHGAFNTGVTGAIEMAKLSKIYFKVSYYFARLMKEVLFLLR